MSNKVVKLPYRSLSKLDKTSLGNIESGKIHVVKINHKTVIIK